MSIRIATRLVAAVYNRRVFLIALLGSALAWACPHASANQDRANTSQTNAEAAAGETAWIKANGLRLKTMIYHSGKLSAHPMLVVVLHGDLLGVGFVPTSTYHYDFAQNAAMKIDDVVAAAVLRPGYLDHTRERSEGDRGHAVGDNYTPEVVDAIAQVIDQLKARYHPAYTLLAGHSGGAAITGDLLGRWPSAVNGALLVSCPCELEAWRKQMQQKQPNFPFWSTSVPGLSPIDLAVKVSRTVHVRLLVGGKDSVTPPEMSQHYAEALRSHGDDVTVTVVPGLEHEILLQPVTLEALRTLMETLEKDPPTAATTSP
jgi:pimeloyl-ACP methyl ester carboxylesterase